MTRTLTKYWLVPHVVYVGDFQHWLLHSSEWTVECDASKSRVDEGDFVYLMNPETGIYAWGMVLDVTLPQTPGEQGYIKISKGAIKPVMIGRNELQSRDELRGPISFPSGKFNYLLNRQVKAIDSVMPTGIAKPPAPADEQFVIGQSVPEDEGLHVEYKEVSLNNIAGEAYEYAVAYLTQAGGRVLFGIRDEDHTVVGITVDLKARDMVQKTVENKLSTISPQILPVTDYWLEFHQVIYASGNQVADCYVFELEIYEKASKNYETAGGKKYLKSFSGRIRIR